MKFILNVCLVLITTMAAAQTHRSDTLIQGIPIRFSSNVSIFPPSWQTAPISARATAIIPREISRCKAISIIAMNKYPQASLKQELAAVYFLSSIKFYDVGYGGTNSTDALFLTNNGISQGYTDLYLEQTFHHEFSSILYRNHAGFLDEAAWLAANIPGFDYNDPENGVGAIRNNQSSQDFDTALCEKGFLTQYSLSGMENDINTFAQNLFSPSEGFWDLVRRYPRIAQKTKLLISFYGQINPIFTPAYFRSFSY